MNTRLYALLPLLAASLAVARTPEKDIRAMFDVQTAALNKGDVGLYMTTIDPQSPGYASTKKMMGGMFLTFKLKFKIESLKVVSVTGNSAQVKMTLVARKVSGPAFKDNRSTIMCTVVKRSGKWMTSSSTALKTEWL